MSPSQNIPQSKALHRAQCYLEDYITRNSLHEGNRLPSVRTLAKAAGVAFVTMLKAVSVLSEKGKVTIRPMSGVFVGKPHNIPSLGRHEPRLPKWLAICQILRQDIFEGIFENKTRLPDFKELQKRYRASYLTIRKAVDSLLKEKVLIEDKRRLVPQVGLPVTPFSSMYLLMGPELFHSFRMTYELEWFELFARSFEAQCAQKNIKLQRMCDIADVQKTINHAGALGYVLWFSDNSIAGQDRLLDILGLLLDHKKEVAVFNLSGQPDGQVFYRKYAQRFPLRKTSRFVIYDIDMHDKKAGYILGRFLLAKGYNKVAYFAAQNDNKWAFDRLQGIKKAFSDVNKHDAIVPFFSVNTTHATLRNNEKSLGISAHSKGTPVDVNFSEQIKVQSIEMQFRQNLLPSYFPVFMSAYSQNDISTWVCSNDYLAQDGAMVFLQHPKRKNGRPIKVVGFGDSRDSLIKGLTTYNFNLSGIAQRMIHCLLYPDLYKKNRASNGMLKIEIDGMVIDRGLETGDKHDNG